MRPFVSQGIDARKDILAVFWDMSICIMPMMLLLGTDTLRWVSETGLARAAP